MCVSPLFKHNAIAKVHLDEPHQQGKPSDAQLAGLLSPSPAEVRCERLSPSKLELGTTLV